MALHRAKRPRISLSALPPAVALGGEALLVLCATTVAALILHGVTAAGVQPLRGQAAALLAAATAGAAAVVALLCALGSRMRADEPMRMAGYAWGFYGLVVMPLGVLGATAALPGSAVSSAAVFLALLALSFAGTRPRWLSGPRAIAGGLAVTALVTALAAVLPPPVAGVLASNAGDAVLLAGWVVLACCFVARGLRTGTPVWWRMGFGLALIAAAHTLLLAGGTAIQFAVLRFIGFLVLLAALCLHARTLVRERRASEDAAAERAAAEEHDRSQRSHEVRNTLTTLSAVTTLMAPRAEAEAAAGGSIPAMIDAEFARLRGLLENTTRGGDTDTAAVGSVLNRLVTLRRAAGARITLDCPPGLFAELPTAGLAQVVTNLLANCARHAAGAEVHVGARPDGRDCVVEVTDAGPGLGADVGATATAGDGLGLALSAQLAEAARGSLQLRAATRFPSGTTAVLRLPLAESPRRVPAVRAHVRAAS